MKRFFLCLLLLFSLFTTLAAQETESAAEELNEQYELFSWEPVAKAKQYGVTIEKYDAAQDIWTDYKEIKTAETQIEVLFTPGVYRVSIATYNLIGRKSKGSDWVQFKILEEHIPYLNEKAFAKHSVWQVPVLYIAKSGSEKTVPADDEYINYAAPTELFGTNAFLVKGRNIFSPKTEFYLVPKDQGGTKDFQNWCDDRVEQKLNILYRNSKEYQVIVSYNPEILYSGYYALEVRNPGNNTDAIDILVLDDTQSQITPEKGFEIDTRYSVNSISIPSYSSTYELSVIGKGVNSATSFYLEPATGTYSYPFESQIQRNTVALEVTETFKQGASTSQIMLSCPVDTLRTGYYNLVAKNWDGTNSKFLCLVKKPFDNDLTKKVKQVKSKYNKKTEVVDFTVQDEKLDAYKTYTLISEYDEPKDSNNKVKLALSYSGKKLVAKLTPDQLTFGKYALMIEDDQKADIIYGVIDNTLKFSMNKMSERAVEEAFFRPEGKDSQITLDADEAGSVQFFDNQVQMTKRMPFFFTGMRMEMAILKDSTNLDLEFDLFNLKYAVVSAGYEYRSMGDNFEQAVFSVLRFEYPNNYVTPYLGVGIGQTLVTPQGGIHGFDDVIEMFKATDRLYAIGQAGVTLFTVLDVRYNLFLNDFLSPEPYFSDSLSFGFSFPLRAYKFKRKTITRQANITKPGLLKAADFVEPDSNVDRVEVYESTSVGGFENYSNLKEVIIDSSVEIIEENAFRNCKNLENVFMRSDFYSDSVPLVIKSNAFADDIMISEIRLPGRTVKVESNAFANWTNGQNIILEWNAYDETDRDLTGLQYCNATIHYADGSLYKGSFNNPLEDERNWVGVNEIKPENVSVYDNDQYVLGIRVKGFGFKWYRTELDSWINQENPQEALDYIKSGSKITFKVQGDGNSYNLVFTTPDGGYFYYRFKTKKDKLITVEIPYKKFKKYNFSSQKKLDVDNLKMFCIMPMCKDELNNVTFFDFEVQ